MPVPKGPVWHLYISTRNTGIEVKADIKWPAMWRVHWNGFVSDMVNLSRAKDAAEVMAGCNIAHPATWRRVIAPAARAIRHASEAPAGSYSDLNQQSHPAL